MTVTVPLVFVFGTLVYLAWRYMGLRMWHIAVTALFGFFLAATSAAPGINRAVSDIIEWLGHH